MSEPTTRKSSLWRSPSQMILGMLRQRADGDTDEERAALGGVEVQPFTLAFTDDALEAHFRRDLGERSLPFARLVMVAGLAFFAAFGLVDFVLFEGEELTKVLQLRFAVGAPILALLLVATWVPALKPHDMSLLMASLLVGGGTIVAMTTVAASPHGDLYYAGVLVGLVLGYTLTPLRFVHATLAGWLLVAAYMACALWVRPIAGERLINNAAFLLCVSIVGMCASYVAELHRREAFLALQIIQREQKALTTANRRLTDLAIRDALTGLMNRRTLMERLTEAIGLNKRYQVTSSVLLIDLDNFKRVNDSLGHVQGDELLRAVANAIRNDVRTPDQAFRYGGDEFVVLLPNTPPEIAAHLAHRLQDRVLHQCNRLLPGGLDVGCSVGVAAIREGIDTGEELLAEVDEALYRAKGKGKGCVEVYALGSPPTLASG